MKRWRCILSLAFVLACMCALCISASAFDTRDLTPPASAEYVVYGMSGAGRNLRAYKFGNGKNVLVAGFAIHGYEDNFEKDGGALVYTANELMKLLDKNRDLISDYGWTVYVLPCMNPDGLIDGYTCNGPGRCTTSWIDTDGSLLYDAGIDLNRSFPLNWTHFSGKRNNNGPKPLASMESRALAEFIQSVKGDGVNLLIDAHGWFQQIITSNGQDSQLFKIFKSRFPNNTYANCSQSQGYFTSYAASLGYAACLFEFPWDVYSMSGFINSGYCGKFNACILDLLYAYGTYNGHSTVCPSHRFNDVVPWAWFHSAVDYVVETDIFNGISETRFAPNDVMTRAMLVTTLWRISGKRTATGQRGKADSSELQKTGIEVIEIDENGEEIESPGVITIQSFSDVVPGAWYEEAVYWAASHGIITGYPDNSFHPNDPLTREQLATIMYRYSVWIGRSVSADSNLSQFPDAGQVASYAYAPMRWAVGAGLISGASGGSGIVLSPRGTASRAQTATILMRYRLGDSKDQYIKVPDSMAVQGLALVEPNIDENYGDLGGN